MSCQFELAERLQTWKCEDLNAKTETIYLFSWGPEVFSQQCSENILWTIYKADCTI
jgi:hypothetical protein